jgi:hypothetical protein
MVSIGRQAFFKFGQVGVLPSCKAETLLRFTKYIPQILKSPVALCVSLAITWSGKITEYISIGRHGSSRSEWK